MHSSSHHVFQKDKIILEFIDLVPDSCLEKQFPKLVLHIGGGGVSKPFFF